MSVIMLLTSSSTRNPALSTKVTRSCLHNYVLIFHLATYVGLADLDNDKRLRWILREIYIPILWMYSVLCWHCILQKLPSYLNIVWLPVLFPQVNTYCSQNSVFILKILTCSNQLSQLCITYTSVILFLSLVFTVFFFPGTFHTSSTFSGMWLKFSSPSILLLLSHLLQVQAVDPPYIRCCTIFVIFPK